MSCHPSGEEAALLANGEKLDRIIELLEEVVGKSGLGGFNFNCRNCGALLDTSHLTTTGLCSQCSH